MKKTRASARARQNVEAGETASSYLQLGSFIRQMRQMKGMLLRDLAAESGYSESLLSRIENDKTTPSLHTLHNIASSLNLTVAELLSNQPMESDIVLRGGKRRTIGSSPDSALPDGMEAEVLTPLGRKSTLQGFLVRLKPGASRTGTRQHEGEEMGYVTRGELLLNVAGATYHLFPGDSFFFASRLAHDYSNPCSTITEVVWVNTPASI
ncbi:cupin domain-containing protein [Mesorhizobium sp. CO1-1-8]|uniref:cupin domain-containing protein n=1 Tax=Mesorhizobium sp. CO1-1-8 TaxID=2876631 RepID=UPI001CD0AA75|nr:cupin domain-containing protein [Mesorhizobium sp. CO1-1-8]MBZ9772584.1 cupin domain-containing protein [Mesorhizobium sp. CO1-1-8]